MISVLGLLSIIFLVAEVPATDVPVSSAVEDLALLTTEICFASSAGQIAFGNDISADKETLQSIGFSSGIQKEMLSRFGSKYESILNRSTMGSKTNGDDAIVLAFGGQMPGCKSMLLSKSDEADLDNFSEAITAEKFGWFEPPNSNATRGNVTKRMFLKRDGNGQPYLMNLMTFNFPDSDLKLMTTVNAVPSGVQLPEGF